jgi:hypothetical protein
MAINQPTHITDTKDLKTFQKVFDNIHQNATGVLYGNTTSVSLSMVPAGSILLVDDGTNRRMYMRTKQNTLTYFESPV